MSDEAEVPSSKAAFLTAEDVERWKSERAALVSQQEELKAQVVALQTRVGEIGGEIAKREESLRNAAPFVPGLADWLSTIDPEEIALTTAIKKALAPHRGRPLPREVIKNLLPSQGFPAQKLNANPNYFSTALKRLVARDEVMEGPPGQFRLKQN